MTREEEINKIAEDYTEIECGLKLKLEEDWTVDDITTAFIKGAKWADKNPKSHWINVKDDLPCKHEKLICSSDKNLTLLVIALVHGFIVQSRMKKLNGNWHWITDEPLYWFPVPEPPKE